MELSYFPDLNNWEYNFSGGFFGGLFTSKVGRANFNNIQLKFGQDVSIIAQKFRSNSNEKYQGLFYGYSVKNWNDGIMKTDNVAIYYEKIITLSNIIGIIKISKMAFLGVL